MTEKRRRWFGGNPTECDICHNDITTDFVDGKTRFGPWACMCFSCYKKNGTGLGTGFGQRYTLEDGIFYKVAG